MAFTEEQLDLIVSFHLSNLSIFTNYVATLDTNGTVMVYLFNNYRAPFGGGGQPDFVGVLSDCLFYKILKNENPSKLSDKFESVTFLREGSNYMFPVVLDPNSGGRTTIIDVVGNINSSNSLGYSTMYDPSLKYKQETNVEVSVPEITIPDIEINNTTDYKEAVTAGMNNYVPSDYLVAIPILISMIIALYLVSRLFKK